MMEFHYGEAEEVRLSISMADGDVIAACRPEKWPQNQILSRERNQFNCNIPRTLAHSIRPGFFAISLSIFIL
jgi:hypothetical protein